MASPGPWGVYSNSGFDPARAAPPTPGMPKAWFSDPFSLLDSMGLGFRTAPSALSYETLRQMAMHNTVLAAIHNTRTTQVANFCQRQPNKYSVGFKIRHKDPHRKLTHSEVEFARDMEEMILRCGVDKNNTRDDFVTFVKKITRDRLRYDQVNIEIVPKRNRKPHSFHAVDAATMRLKVNRKRGGPQKLEHVGRKPRYVQVINGVVVNEFTDDEMSWGIANPRSDLVVSGYGYSEEEQLITTVTAHIWAEEWNRKVFSQGATTKGLINLRGNIPPQQLEAFKRQWITQVSSVTNAWRTPIINSEGIEFVSLQPTNNEMGYSAWLEYLIKIACAIYLIDPSEINFDTRAGVGNQPMFMTTNEAQQKISKDRGLQPILRFFANLINKHIVSNIDDAWQFEFLGLDAKTEEQSIELRLKELQSYKTLNEIRREADNLPPVEDGDVVLNPTYVGFKSQQAMQKQQQQAMAAQGGQQPGAPGMPPGAAAPPPESLFPNGKQPPFEREEQHAGAHITARVNDDEAKGRELRAGRTTIRPPEWERTIHASTTSRDTLRKGGVEYIEVEE